MRSRIVLLSLAFTGAVASVSGKSASHQMTIIDLSNATFPARPVLWQGGAIFDLGLPPNGAGCFTHAINRHGEIVGECAFVWDRLGWRDPFSSAAYSNRQSVYDARVFYRHEVYTPQLVIDGQLERVGSDVDAVQRAIKQAAQAPKAVVEVAAVRAGERALRVNVHVTVPPTLVLRDSADVVVAITEDNHTEEGVLRGIGDGAGQSHLSLFTYNEFGELAASGVPITLCVATANGVAIMSPPDVAEH
jgi:Protein of unknown function (DUF1223)